MGINRMSDEKRNTMVVVILALILLLPLGYYGVHSVLARDTEPFLEMPDEKYEKCVRETSYMRFNHWVLLKEIRDEYVRVGTRGEISLNNCKECHTSRVRFCDQCHNTVDLTPDCFDCHYYPDYPEASPKASGTAHLNETKPFPGENEH